MKPDERFFVGQKAFIEKEGKLLVVIDPLVGLDMPGGKIQIGETDLEAAFRRELTEETQLDVHIGAPFHTWIWTNHTPGHRNFGKKIFLVGYRCKYNSGNLTLSEEHSKFFWVTKEDYKTSLHKYWDDQNPLCRVLEAYFAI